MLQSSFKLLNWMHKVNKLIKQVEAMSEWMDEWNDSCHFSFMHLSTQYVITEY
jgi:hypothetical protein